MLGSSIWQDKIEDTNKSAYVLNAYAGFWSSRDCTTKFATELKSGHLKKKNV